MPLGFDSVSQSPLSALPLATSVQPIVSHWFTLASDITADLVLDSTAGYRLAIDSLADSSLSLNSILRLS